MRFVESFAARSALTNWSVRLLFSFRHTHIYIYITLYYLTLSFLLLPLARKNFPISSKNSRQLGRSRRISKKNRTTRGRGGGGTSTTENECENVRSQLRSIRELLLCYLVLLFPPAEKGARSSSRRVPSNGNRRNRVPLVYTRVVPLIITYRLTRYRVRHKPLFFFFLLAVQRTSWNIILLAHTLGTCDLFPAAGPLLLQNASLLPALRCLSRLRNRSKHSKERDSLLLSTLSRSKGQEKYGPVLGCIDEREFDRQANIRSEEYRRLWRVR